MILRVGAPFLLFAFCLTSGVSSFQGVSQCSNQFGIDYHTQDNFTDHMCLYCLDTMIFGNSPVWKNWALANHWRIDILHKGNLIIDDRGVGHRLSYRELKEALIKKANNSHFLLKEFSSHFYLVKCHCTLKYGLTFSVCCFQDTFLDCCQDASDCYGRMIENSHTEPGHCPTHWDGWNCWESAPPGKELVTCPDMTEYLLGYLPPRYARNSAINQCDTNGKWHLRWNKYYNKWMGHADYSQCSRLKIPQ